jgi:NADPH:quinone reductase
MRVIQLNHITPDYSGLQVKEYPKPVPQKGEILIKVRCAPVNPSDLMMLAGKYLVTEKPPFVPGLVGVGDIVENRGGILGTLVMSISRRVAFTPIQGKNGTWGEYAISSPKLCVPLSDKLADEDAVNLLSNAATAIGLVETIRQAKTPSVVITAAAGEVGRMLNTITLSYGITPINIVRTPEQVNILRQMGAVHNLDMSQEMFQQELRNLTHKLNARMAIDAIAGDMPNALMDAMPHHSTIVILGRLSGESITIDGLTQLVGKQHTLKGFSINEWFLSKNIIGQIFASLQAQRLLQNGYKTRIQHRVSLDEAAQKMSGLTHSLTKGKTLIYPDRTR